MKMKNYHIQDSPTFFKLEYTRTSKDYFDLILGLIASLFCLATLVFLIRLQLIADFSWFNLFTTALVGFVAVKSISYFLARASNTSRHVLYLDKVSKRFTIRDSIFSKQVLAVQNVMRIESELHTDIGGSSENPKRRYWGEINLIMNHSKVWNLVIINSPYLLHSNTINIEKELKADCKALANKLAFGLGTVAR